MRKAADPLCACFQTGAMHLLVLMLVLLYLAAAVPGKPEPVVLAASSNRAWLVAAWFTSNLFNPLFCDRSHRAMADFSTAGAHEPRQFHPCRGHEGLAKRATITVEDEHFVVPTQDSEVIIFVDQFGKAILTETDTVVIVPATPSSTLHPSTQALVPITTYTTTVAIETAPTETTTFVTVKPSDVHGSVSTSVSSSLILTAEVELPSPVIVTTAGGMPMVTIVPKPTTTPLPVPVSFPVPSSIPRNGIAYSPYKHGQACKSLGEVEADFAIFAHNYTTIRLYGIDCDQVSKVYQASRKYGNLLMIGIWDVDTIQDSVEIIAKGVMGEWDAVSMVTIGNERVTNGMSTVEQMVAAISQTRVALRAAGFSGPVSTVDTCGTMLIHPVLCDSSDVCTINVHPFFDAFTPATRSGPFVTSSLALLRARLADPNQRIVIAESGYPWRGVPNGVAVPSLANQAIALSQIIEVVPDPADLVLFTALNDMWKKAEPNTFYAEPFWGIGGRYSPADAGLDQQ
jgi:exo-beta-1,3-glucanase (GH17 family)